MMNKKIIFTILLAILLAPMCMEAKKKVKKEDVPQVLNYPSAEVGEFRLHGGEVVIKGRLITQVPQMIEQMNAHFNVIMRDYIVKKEKTTTIEFKSDGTFSLNVRVPYPMFLLVHPLAMVYACPGDTIDLTIDITKPKREEGMIISGTGVSGEVSKLVETMIEKYCKFPMRDNIHEQGPDSLMKWKDAQVARLDDVVRQMNAGLPELEGCSPLASDILRTFILKQHLEHICRYYNLTDLDNTDKAAYWQQYFSFLAPREKYLLDNPLLMISADEFFFNYVEVSVMRPLYTTASKGLILPVDYNPGTAKMLAEEKHNSIYEAKKLAIDELQEKLHLSPTNFSTQVSMLRELFNTLKWFKDDYDTASEDVASTMPFITHPALIRRAVLTYRDYVKENELKVVEDKPLTKGDSIFQRIIEPYKGNVLYVDFWEMSCGPCRAGMLSMRDEVEANKDKPVKYLYITDDTPEDCRSFLEPNNIQGEHIHITRSEWGYLQEKFQFSAIPFVLLFDKQGNQRKDVTVEQLLNE